MSEPKFAGTRIRVLLLAGVVTGAFAPALGSETAGGEALAPMRLLREIRSPRLDIASGVELRNVELELGLARFDIQRGLLVPARIGDGRVGEMVFVGEARFRLPPPNPIEAEQLELFTNRRELDLSVSEAVLVLADPEILGRLLHREPASPDPALVAHVEELHERWLDRPERRNTGVESSIFKFLVGDTSYRDYFALWATSYEVGDFVYQIDPEEGEPITLAAFTPVDVRGWDRLRLAREIRIQQRKGRWLGVQVQDIGAWDVWLSAPWRPLDEGVPGNAAFEAAHYDLDVTVERDRMLLRGLARLEIETQVAGRRVLTLDLFRDLVVERVLDEGGRALPVVRSGNETLVQLPEPSVAGRRFELQVAWSGRALKWVGPDVWDLEDTGTWYPRIGAVDRATYDVKLAWPSKRELIASGSLVEEGHDGRYRWQRRRLDAPSTTFSFVIGDFVVDHERVGHVDLTVAFDRAAPARLTPELRQAVTGSVVDTLKFFEERFGPYPMDHLTVATLPRSFSQSYPGLIVLTDSVVQDDDPFGSLRVGQVRRSLVAHEMAHQWWGNLVGWWSYRDQWLSEAMSNYSALLYEAHREGADSTFLAQMSAGWRDMLGQRTPSGRTLESMGPVVLGGRLNSSLSNSAYQAIVYRKGAVVLAMLARAVGEEAFVAMLRELAGALGNNVLTTESFIAAMERMSGLELDGFARRFIYGTGIPEVYYAYRTEQRDDGAWAVTGEARLLADPAYAFRLVRLGEVGWDVVRIALPESDAESEMLMVPFRIPLQEAGATANRTGRVTRGDWGRLMIEGGHQEFELLASGPPAGLQLDPRGEILARFYPADRYPKRGLRYHAQNLAHEGRIDEAERAYRDALAAAVEVPPPDQGADAGAAAWENLQIRLRLARLYLDSDRLDAAAAELDAADAVAADEPRLRVEREVLRSRIDLRRGDAEPAWRRLRRTLKQFSNEQAVRTLDMLVDQMQIVSERQALTEGWALLAAASHASDHVEDYPWALAGAVARGVDTSALEMIAGRP